MKRKPKNTRALQWHPAFYACARIEFSEEAEEFYFNNEYQLGTKPKEIDVLIIKRNPDRKIQKIRTFLGQAAPHLTGRLPFSL